MVEMEERIEEVTREKNIALKEKSQILDEVTELSFFACIGLIQGCIIIIK